MKHIFISHSSVDTEWAQSICGLLESHGAKCFLDIRDLDRRKPDWSVELIRALTGSSHVVLLLTRDSVSSEEVMNEIVNASARGIDIIPVLRENLPVRDKLLYYIRKYEWINLFEFSDEDGNNILCERCIGKSIKPIHEHAVRVEVRELTQHEDSCFASIHNGGYGAGYDKCLLQNGVSGWFPNDIVLEEVLRKDFTFSAIGMPELDVEYQAFCQTDEVKKMRLRDNDRVRWMVAGIYQNRKVFITLQKTRYSMTTFWWNRVRNNPSMQEKMAKHVFAQQDIFFPNSFCLHLIIETQDNMLICTRISNNKKNDYGRTIAITIGEQISEVDFGDKTTNNDQFVDLWVKRSLIEEFNFQNQDYEKYVDVSSVRVLALSYEGDIYNFAIPVFVRLKMNYAGLITYLNSTNKNIDEFTEVFSITASEALEITRAWHNPEKRSAYHPSAFLRALLYSVYKGADKEQPSETPLL